MKRNNFRILGSLLISLVIIISCQQKNQESNTPILQNSETKNSEDTSKKNKVLLDTNVVAISAIDLTSEYVANEVKADHDFKGKQIIVTGIITDIKKGITDNIYVVLKGSERSRSVQCYYDNEEEALTLKKGMQVSFRGKCDGLWVNVILNNCERVGEFAK